MLTKYNNEYNLTLVSPPVLYYKNTRSNTMSNNKYCVTSDTKYILLFIHHCKYTKEINGKYSHKQYLVGYKS